MSVDLSTADITGTGAAGRVLKGDVLAYVAGKDAGAITTGEGVPSGSGRSVAGISREEGPEEAAEALLAGSVGRALDAGFEGRAGALGSAGSGGVVEEEPLRRPAKEERRAVGGRERRDSVAVPIKGARKRVDRSIDCGVVPWGGGGRCRFVWTVRVRRWRRRRLEDAVLL